MKMCYRGVSYESNPTQVAVEGKKNVVQFRGRSYEIRHAVMNLAHKDQDGLVYRGVSVSTGKSAKFLGRSYDIQQIVLVPSCVLG